MAVPKSRRGKSNVKFLSLCHDIYVKVWSMSAKFQQKYYLDITVDLHRHVQTLDDQINAANSIIPKTFEEYNERHMFFVRVRGQFIALSVKLDNYFDILSEDWKQVPPGYNPRFSPQDLEEIQLMIDSELELINGVLISDSKRYGGLPSANASHIPSGSEP